MLTQDENRELTDGNVEELLEALSGLDQSLTGMGLRGNWSRGNIQVDNFSFKEFHCRGVRKSGAIGEQV